MLNGNEFVTNGVFLSVAGMPPGFLNQAFAGMNALFDQHGFPEPELAAMSMGLVVLVAPSEKNRRFVRNFYILLTN